MPLATKLIVAGAAIFLVALMLAGAVGANLAFSLIGILGISISLSAGGWIAIRAAKMAWKDSLNTEETEARMPIVDLDDEAYLKTIRERMKGDGLQVVSGVSLDHRKVDFLAVENRIISPS